MYTTIERRNMKAAQISEYGDPSVIKISEVEKPVPARDQVLVEVHASSINPFDTAIRSGVYKDSIKLNLPVTLGGDIAGVVAEIGAEVSNIKVGDKVYGQANVVAGNSGAFAEFAATSAKQAAKMPGNLDFNEAASLPLVGVSAWQAIAEHVKLQPGQRIFIHGGTGGIGTIAIQIAKHIGAYVATTASEDGIEYVNALGADEVIDFKNQDFSKILNGFDAVFDTVGGDDFTKSLNILKKGGIAVSMIAQAPEEKAKELEVTALTQATKVTTDALDELSKLIESGAVKPQVDKVYKFENIAEAFSAKETGTVKGKIVTEIR